MLVSNAFEVYTYGMMITYETDDVLIFDFENFMILV